MWMMPLHLHVNQKSDYDYDDDDAYVQCVYIVSTKYQIASSKAVVAVDPPIKALSMHIQKPYNGIIV